MNRKKKRGGTEVAFRPQTIIEARYDLDRRQNDILDILLGIVGEGDDTEENTRYEINIGDVKHLYNLHDESNAYSYLQKAVKKFEGLGFRLKEDEGTDIYYPWFSKIKYQKKRGDESRSKIVLDLHPEVKEMIMSAKQGAYYRIEYPLNLTKKYSKRLYYLLKDKETFNGGVFVIAFDELRRMMKIPESYANGNVKREILDKPYEEINGNTDISFEYELIYERLPSGQQGISAVRFRVKRIKRNRTVVEYETIEKNGESVVATEEEQEVIDILDCSLKEAKDILRTANANDRTHDQLIEILSYTLKKQVENRVGYVLTILKNGYNEPTKLGGKQGGSSWNNKELDTAYSQMNFADLEKQILSN
ncbi:MAG: replication initiation protein [Lachnospiraceae bacterium]|nr:replication initiation protein [Lachnospiraceae bacterium]